MENLSDKVREVAGSHQLHDPREITEALLKLLSPEDKERALRQALLPYVRNVLNNQQRQAFNAVRNHGQETQAKPKAQQKAQPKAGTRRPSRSAKVAGIRDWWVEAMKSSVSIEGTWKSFGDCSPKDIRWMADSRHELAQANKSQAVQYEELAELMEEHGVSKVEELPREVFSKAEIAGQAA